jgi:hypothetical protein
MKNRDYTGLIRTPSSMAWLIGHRAKLKGQLDRIRRLEKTLPGAAKKIKAEMAAIDAVIPLHRVKVDPQAIKGVRPRGPRIAAHGVMTKSLLSQMRVADGKPLYTTELALQFARENCIDTATVSHASLMDRVKKQLGALVDKGLVQRHHAHCTRGMGSWSLAEDDDEEDEDE